MNFHGNAFPDKIRVVEIGNDMFRLPLLGSQKLMQIAYGTPDDTGSMGLEDVVAAANQIVEGKLAIENGPLVAIPRDSTLGPAQGVPVVVLCMIGDDYVYNPRVRADLLVIEQNGRVYLYNATYLEQARLRNASGVVAEWNVMVRGINPPLFRVAGREPGTKGLILKYETLVRTSLFTEQLLSEDEYAGATFNLSPATIYFRSTLPASSPLIHQNAALKPAPATPPAPVFDQNVTVSNYVRRINQSRVACINRMRSNKISTTDGHVLQIPVNGEYAFAPPKDAQPCILIKAMDNGFISRKAENEEYVVLVYVIGHGASVNLALMDEETWSAWAKHRDSTAETSVIYHRMADGVDGVDQFVLINSPDPSGRAVAEMRLTVQHDDAGALTVLKAGGRRSSQKGAVASFAQLFFPVVLSVDRERYNQIYRMKQGGSRANNMFVFEDVVIPVLGKKSNWMSYNILAERLPVLGDPMIPTIPEYVQWMQERWEAVRIDLAPLLLEIAVGYISPSNRYMLVTHTGQRVPVSALLFYALWEFPSTFEKLGDVMVHSAWAASIRKVSGPVVRFDEPISEIVTRRDVPARAGAFSGNGVPVGSKGALSDAEKWHNSVLAAFLRSDINNIALLADIAMGVESDKYAWELISVKGERFAVSGLMFQLIFVFSVAAPVPFLSIGRMFVRHDWWTYLVERTSGSLLFVDPVGEVKTSEIRQTAPYKRLRGEAEIDNSEIPLHLGTCSQAE